jgi:hypothetical protein
MSEFNENYINIAIFGGIILAQCILVERQLVKRQVVEFQLVEWQVVLWLLVKRLFRLMNRSSNDFFCRNSIPTQGRR